METIFQATKVNGPASIFLCLPWMEQDGFG